MVDEQVLAVGDAETTVRRFGAPGTVRLILAHGAGTHQRHPSMVALAEGLAARGLEVLTFDFLYTAAGRKVPDRTPQLEACWRAVLDWARGLDDKRLAIGGRSMGGRIASQVAAAGVEGVRALLFLGYPLHPPAKPAQRRDAHLPKIREPMLFVQGERDPFGTPDELRPLLARLPRAELFVVEGGNHSLVVPKRNAPPQTEVDAAVQRKLADWLESLS